MSDTTAADREVAAFERNLTNRLRALTEGPQAAAAKANNSGTILYGLTILVVAIVLLRVFAPHIGMLLHPSLRSAPAMAATDDTSTRLATEEKMLAEFASSFRSTPEGQGNVLGSESVAARVDPIAEFFKSAPAHIAELRRLLASAIHTEKREAGPMALAQMSQKMTAFKIGANVPELLPAWQVCSAFEGLIRQLSERANTLTPSILRTAARALDLLEYLCRPGVRADLTRAPAVRLLVVDDDPLSRRLISTALKKAFAEPEQACDGEVALEMMTISSYDVVFLDVEMPGVDGFELCLKIRQTIANKHTPVVFVTCRSDFDSRATSVRSGGQDLIAKPFLSFEITLKALTMVLEKRLGLRQQQQLVKGNGDPQSQTSQTQRIPRPAEAAPAVLAGC